MTYLKLLDMPATKQLIADFNSATESMTAYAAAAGTWTEDLAAERSDTIEQIAGAVATEREAAIKQIADEVAGERDALAQALATARRAFFEDIEKQRGAIGELGTTIDKAHGLADSLREVASTSRETVAAVDKLVARFDKPEDDTEPAGEPLDIAEITAALKETTRAANELTELVTATDGFLASETWDTRLDQIDQRFDHAFWLGVALILVACPALLGTAVTYRVIVQRMRRAAS